MRILKLLFLLLLLVPSIPSIAQEGSRGYIRIPILSNVEDFGQILPQTCRSVDRCEIANLIFPRLIGVDPDTQYYSPNKQGNALSERLRVSPDGLEHTFTLRNDMYWSDGTQITAEDVVFSFQAQGFYGYIVDVQAVDDFTVTIFMSERSCTALFDMDLGIIPAHAFDYDPDSVYDSSFGVEPSVTSGPFLFDRIDTSANQIILRANPDYVGGEVQSDGLILVGIEDQNEVVDRFLAGELDVTNVIPQSRFKEVSATAGIQFFEFPSTVWEYVALNMADPGNPQDGQSGGTLIDQGIHPIFSDVLVRRALQSALNVPSIIDSAVFGEATIMPSYEIPQSWAFNADLPPVPYDAARAEELLDQAGWIAGGDGIRVAQNSAYAPDGTRLSFTLTTNAGNPRREKAAAAIRDQLREIGVEVIVDLIDFDALLDLSDMQTFDAILLGWRNAIPVDPTPSMFLPVNDYSGFSSGNYVSYQNDEVIELDTEGDLASNCEPSPRRPFYHQIQEIVQKDQPFLFLYTLNQAYAAQSNVQNFELYPNMFYYNAHEWSLDG